MKCEGGGQKAIYPRHLQQPKSWQRACRTRHVTSSISAAETRSHFRSRRLPRCFTMSGSPALQRRQPEPSFYWLTSSSCLSQPTVRSSLDTIKSDGNLGLYGALNVSSTQELKDLLNCLILSEGAYKIVDHGQDDAAKMVSKLKGVFPSGLVTIETVQWSLGSVYHRYMLAEDADTVYAAFMGTKQRRDLITNAAVLLDPIWPACEPKTNGIPSAHRGFLSRAQAIPIEGLFANACRRGKRLVLTGHSLGGAVAALSAVRLLKQLPEGGDAALRCLTFACPAIGNQALAEFTSKSGWEQNFQNFLVPEDVVPRLLASPEQTPEQVANAAIAALQPVEAEKIGDEFVEWTLGLFENIYEVSASWGGLTGNFVPPTSKGQRQKASSALAAADPQPRSKLLHSRTSPLHSHVAAGPSRPEALSSVELEDRLGSVKALQEADSGEGTAISTVEWEEEERAELDRLRQEHNSDLSPASAGSARAGKVKGRLGRQKLTASQEVFFPWSVKPLPSAWSFAGKALLSATGNFGRMRGRWVPPPKSQISHGGLPSALALASSSQSDDSSESAGGRANTHRSLSKNAANVEFDVAAGREGRSRDGVLDVGPAAGLQSREEQMENVTEPAVNGAACKSERDAGGKRWLTGASPSARIGRLGANVGRAASGAARGAARIVSAPLRVAQRRYAVLGQQAFLSTAGVIPATAGEADQSFQKGLEGAAQSSRASALSFPGSWNASASAIVSQQLPIAAARKRQPFLMHKMAFHRARILSIVEQFVPAGRGRSPPLHPSDDQVLLSETLAPPLKPFRAEVFLPYSLPDDQDVKTMLEDLGSLSSLPPMTAALQQSAASKRFQWLKPWRWISGFGWRSSKRSAVELKALIRGQGLENCTSIQAKGRGETEPRSQVQDVVEGDWCHSEILYRPRQPSPLQINKMLGFHRKGPLRTAAKVLVWVHEATKNATDLLDRTNVMESRDCLLASISLPVDLMRRLEGRLLQQAGEDSGLLVHLTSDFQTVKIPLQVHGGSSWFVSDIRSLSQLFNYWLN